MMLSFYQGNKMFRLCVIGTFLIALGFLLGCGEKNDPRKVIKVERNLKKVLDTKDKSD